MLQDKVNELIERGKALKAANPGLVSLRFSIDGLHYNDVKEAYPDDEFNALSEDKLFIILYEDSMSICVSLITVPLKIKTTIEVIEQTEPA